MVKRVLFPIAALALIGPFLYGFTAYRAQCIKRIAIRLYTRDKEDRLTRSNRSNGYDYEPEMVKKMLWLRHVNGRIKHFEVKEVSCPLWPEGEVTVVRSVERDRSGKEIPIGGPHSFYDVKRLQKTSLGPN